MAAVLEATTLVRGMLDRSEIASSVAALDRALATTDEALRSVAEGDADLRRTWHLVAVMSAVARGLLADGIVTDRRGFRALNGEDFLDWISVTAPCPRWPTSRSSRASTTSSSRRPARRGRDAG